MKTSSVLNIRSTFSDGKLSVPQLVDFYGTQKVGAIAITDPLHDPSTLRGKASTVFRRSLRPAVLRLYREILRSEADRAWKQYGMVLIPGIEMVLASSASNAPKCLALGIDNAVEMLTHFDHAQLWVEERGGVWVTTDAAPGKWMCWLECRVEAGVARNAHHARLEILAAIRHGKFSNPERENHDSIHDRNGIIAAGDIGHRPSLWGNVAGAQAVPSEIGSDRR